MKKAYIRENGKTNLSTGCFVFWVICFIHGEKKKWRTAKTHTTSLVSEMR